MTRPLVGDLVRLRAIEPDDLAHIHRWRNDWSVTATLTETFPVSLVAKYAEKPRASYAEVEMIVERLDDSLPIGQVVLMSYRPQARCARLGILIGEPGTRGKGYGTDALRTLCRFGFEMMNLHRIELEVFADNEAAIRVYERVGFVREGVRKESFWKAGRWRDITGMGLLEGQLR